MVQQKLLLQKMEEATTILRTLKEERDAAFTRINTLEHDNREIHALLTLVEARVEEMLSTGSTTARTGLNVPPAPTQRRTESPAAPSSDQPRPESPVAVASAQRRLEAPAAPVQQKAEMPAPPAERRLETPVVSARPEAETKAPSADRAQDKSENVTTAQTNEEKAAPRSFTDLKERFRRPFP